MSDRSHLPPLPVILSPVAGDGRAADRGRWLRQRLSPHYSLTVFTPRTLEALGRDVAAAVACAAPLLAVVGGDGTLHHVINAVAGTDVTLAPIPTGSGNDFCRGIGLGTEPESAVRAIVGGRTRAIDLIEVNGTRVCTVAGVGLVAASALWTAQRMAPGSPWRPLVRLAGAHAYLVTAGARILACPSIADPGIIRWRTDDGTWRTSSGRFHGAFLCALPTLGAGLRLPVASLADDGRFEVAVLPETARTTLIRYLPRLRRGKPVPPAVLAVHRTDAVCIEWPEGTDVLGDGEPLGRTRLVDVRVLSRALRVTAP